MSRTFAEAALAASIALAVAGCSPAPRAAAEAPAGPHVAADNDVAAGRYLIVLGGCNDCHTPGWAQTGGKVPESQWLTGIPVGRRGPWGTTYAQNLRVIPTKMSEDAFVTMLRTRKALPPMPWMNVNALQEGDARAIYRYLKSLGPTGGSMPATVPPGKEPTTPYFVMDPPTPPSVR